MKKNNVKTEAKKQQRKTASKARRKRRVAAREQVIAAQITRRLKPLSNLLKAHEKTIKELQVKLAASGSVSVDTETKSINVQVPATEQAT